MSKTYPGILSGILNGLFMICLTYSSNPIRTPVVIQSVLLGLAIIPSAIFTRTILHKILIYSKKYIIISAILLFFAILFSTIPILNNTKTNEFNNNNFLWMILYLLAIIFFSLTNILQEKYISNTNATFTNKIRFSFYCNGIQLIILLLLSWIDLLIGYNNSALSANNDFIASFYIYISDWQKNLLIHAFVLVLVASFIFSISLNAISTNYNMILTNIINQSVAIFFTLFPNLNSGLHYPINITLMSLLCSITSAYFWFKSQSHNYKHLNEKTPLITPDIK